ncbi:uncharacterized mitochondrial protein AtMg00810-like [Nicotiana tomentosiformis]|uniref:uncharacterized mitochondrial protein AtMg00810-like n=1 Tax=Nicotiana tomentosiformis TaxID=4098 RepID=UPI00388C9C26
MKDLGEVKFFLGIEFARSKEEIVMNQRKYAMEMISESGLSGARPAGTPLEMNQKLKSADYDSWMKTNATDAVLKDPSSYQRMYRPLANFIHYPKVSHIEAAFRVKIRHCYLVKFGDALISWKSKKQETISRSSAEAEFRSMAACAAEVTWLVGLFGELGVKIELPVELLCDSKAAI